MTTLLVLAVFFQSFAISLGVGSSTLAILNFFSAIADGTIDATERRMMGIVYVVLRVAMGAILISTLVVVYILYGYGAILSLPTFIIAQLLILLVLFINAVLMTYHLMPSTFGPAIQAGSWYTLGSLSALAVLGYTNFSLFHFALGYITWVILAIGIVNGVMSILKERQTTSSN